MQTRRQILKAASASGAACALMGSPLSPLRAAVPAQSFRPSALWLDTHGKPIQAHAGSIMKVGNTFYWYGENKERTLPGSGIYHWGVRAYASKDLYNWEDAGLIIPPVPDDPTSPLHPSTFLDRPHILFNPRTNKYVCWIKLQEKDGRQTRTVLIADRFTGPCQIIHTGMQPDGMNAGDFDLVTSPDDGKAYMYFERVHTELICTDLTSDYTDVTGYYSTHFPRGAPPFVREAPAYFRRGDKHYLITSGTTAYYPNPSEVAVADSFHGPWTSLGNLHPSDRSLTSFNSQVSSVFKHPAKKDLFIALADRWIPDLPQIEGPAYGTGEAYRQIAELFTSRFGHGGPPFTKERAQELLSRTVNINTSRSTYVWLPILFDDDRPYVAWREKWSLDEFA